MAAQDNNQASYDSTNALAISRVFDAPPARVFEAWSSAESDEALVLSRTTWSVPEATIDFRPGGVSDICMRAPDGTEFLVARPLHGDRRAEAPGLQVWHGGRRRPQIRRRHARPVRAGRDGARASASARATRSATPRSPPSRRPRRRAGARRSTGWSKKRRAEAGRNGRKSGRL